jgi:DNA-binding response OmpR family regulator
VPLSAGWCAGYILVVEEDVFGTEALKTSLLAEGHAVTLRRPSEAVAHIADHPLDLIVLNSPFSSDIELLRQIREGGCSALVLMLSHRNEENDKVQAFRLGADDYVVTPVGVPELTARVGALLRRVARSEPQAAGSHKTLRFGQVVVNRSTRLVTREGRIVSLTPREFDLLDYLLAANGRIVSRTTVMRHVWRYAAGIASRTIDQHIARLRFKLEQDPLHPVHILTVRKAGYRLSCVLETEPAPVSIASDTPPEA